MPKVRSVGLGVGSSDCLLTPSFLCHLTGSERQQRLLDALGNPAAPANGDATAGDATAAAPMATESSSDPTPSSSSAAAGASQKKSAHGTKKQDPNALPKEVATTLPEADAYLSLLVLLTLLDKSPAADYPAAQQYAAQEIEYFAQMNRRTMDQLMSKFYFYWVRAHELNGDDSTVLRP